MIYVSVIVPVYNSGNVIEDCLKNIRNQNEIDLSTIEIIVVDDASTDLSAQKAAGLCDRLITLPKNSGAAAARNAGAKAASGDIIVFLDSDVLLEPNSLSRFIAIFENDGHVSAAVGRYSEMPADTKPLNVYHNAFTRYHHDLSSKEIDWFWGALGAVRKEAFIQAQGFDERYQGASAEDLALGRALFDQGHRIVYAPQVQGVHARQFTISNMIKNDYQKAVIGMKMWFSGRLPSNVQGFANPKTVMTTFLLVLCLFLVLLNFAIHVPYMAGIIFLIFLSLIMINRSYYAYLNEILDLKFAILAPFLHWLQMYIIIAGAIMGFCGHLFGRTAFGRPRWI